MALCQLREHAGFNYIEKPTGREEGGLTMLTLTVGVFIGLALAGFLLRLR